MSAPVFGEPLGPGGVAQRMAEIRSKIDEAFGRTPDSTEFMNAMQRTMSAPNGLSGPIGAGQNPLSPFGEGVGVDGAAPAGLEGMIRSAANKNGVDPDLFDSLVRQESGYSPTARSKVGAMGLTQLMPNTALSLGVTNPFDPAQNLDGGARYLKAQIDRFGDVGHALAAYNAGPGAVLRHGGIPPYPETQSYVRSILSRTERAKETTHG